MNKRLEEKLAMLAFGDMSPEETARLEQEVAGDREASQVLEQYRGMRTDLKAMAQVPEHQLSTERLRHAILNEGIKPKARPQLGWLWMPAMACALAFGFMMLRRGQNVLPMTGDSFALAPTHTSSMDYPGAEFAFATAGGEIRSVETPTPTPTPQVQPQLVSNRTSMVSRHRVDSRRIDELKERVLEEFQNTMLTNNTPSAPATADVAAMTTKPAAASAPIVLIDSAKDKSTGAQRATEVDSASNVVVGG